MRHWHTRTSSTPVIWPALVQAADMEKRLAAATKSATAAEEAAAVARAVSMDSERRRQGLEKKLVGSRKRGHMPATADAQKCAWAPFMHSQMPELCSLG